MEQSYTFAHVVVFVAVIMLLSGLIGGILAGFKNREFSFWIAWSFVFPPSLLVLLLLPRLKGLRPRRPTLDEEDARIGD